MKDTQTEELKKAFEILLAGAKTFNLKLVKDENNTFDLIDADNEEGNEHAGAAGALMGLLFVLLQNDPERYEALADFLLERATPQIIT